MKHNARASVKSRIFFIYSGGIMTIDQWHTKVESMTAKELSFPFSGDA